jgi:hypothetical protein
MTRLSGLQLVSGYLYRAFLGHRVPRALMEEG